MQQGDIAAGGGGHGGGVHVLRPGLEQPLDDVRVGVAAEAAHGEAERRLIPDAVPGIDVGAFGDQLLHQVDIAGFFLGSCGLGIPGVGTPLHVLGGEECGEAVVILQLRICAVIEQIRAAQVVDQHQQEDARDPRQHCFPFEPMQDGWDFARGGPAFFDLVKSAAVDHPEIALDAGPRNRGARQRPVEPDEVEGAADPRDPGDEMCPAKQEIRPIAQPVHGR